MGLSYSIDLYFNVKDVECVIRGIEDIAEPSSEGSTEITLPDKTFIKMPLSSNFKSASLQLLPNQQYISLETSLWFPIDHYLQTYINELYDDPERALFKSKFLNSRNGYLSAQIGYIYVLIAIGQQYAWVSFTAATNRMSRLFEQSKSIHQTFLSILKACDGFIGLICTEDNEFLRLENSSSKVFIDWEDWDTDIDGLVKYILSIG